MDTEKTILVVDDRINALKVLMLFLADKGYRVLEASSGPQALAVFQDHPEIDVVLSDLKMPGMSGLDLYKAMLEVRPVPPFIIMTAYATVETAISALKEGVTDYLIKPLNYEELPIVLANACRQAEMSRELAALRQEVRKEQCFHGMLGVSRPMREIFEMVRTVGPTDAAVLITGETGTGKELLAHSLHEESRRRDRPMVCINCAALTETLLEAEMFGYVKGAFTGALTDRKGRLEMAHEGTLFLDEISNMTLHLQAKFLRFLQDGSFEPVGANWSRRVDVRLVAATNADLEAQIAAGRFMRDLLYRIEVIAMHLPPLRERVEDIPILVEHFIAHYARHYMKSIEGVAPDAMQALLDYPWPGNVRELENCLARAVILSKQSVLGRDDLPGKMTEGARAEAGSGEAGREDAPPVEGVTLKDMETRLIADTIRRCQGNKTLAAKVLGISRKGLYEKMARLGIKEDLL
ncbi:sigma-54-dependent transcriptional regulator [Desulfatiglans anilini]|uniref:sigma-54-dependent transcriptional regulator n=1 Tax=Desulfatiglans anilini TaxID=90728 RepID=UPI00041966A5|nr:sigma-54 dependent transcriptional regulator [Desulfatiglans anilini]